MASYINVSAAKAEAEKLLTEKDDLQKKIAIVRTDLRNAVTMNGATAEEKAWISKTFPEVKRSRKGKSS